MLSSTRRWDKVLKHAYADSWRRLYAPKRNTTGFRRKIKPAGRTPASRLLCQLPSSVL